LLPVKIERIAACLDSYFYRYRKIWQVAIETIGEGNNMKKRSSRGNVPRLVVSVPDSPTEVIQPATEEPVAKHSLLYLSLRDSERLYAALADPPEPSEMIRNIAQKHAETAEIVW
jgi:hypothetical protein